MDVVWHELKPEESKGIKVDVTCWERKSKLQNWLSKRTNKVRLVSRKAKPYEYIFQCLTESKWTQKDIKDYSRTWDSKVGSDSPGTYLFFSYILLYSGLAHNNQPGLVAAIVQLNHFLFFDISILIFKIYFDRVLLLPLPSSDYFLNRRLLVSVWWKEKRADYSTSKTWSLQKCIMVKQALNSVASLCCSIVSVQNANANSCFHLNYHRQLLSLSSTKVTFSPNWEGKTGGEDERRICRANGMCTVVNDGKINVRMFDFTTV